MKKNLSGKKLTLKRETLRKLNDTELRHVAGGATWRCGSYVSACCPCTGTSNPPTSPTMCPIE